MFKRDPLNDLTDKRRITLQLNKAMFNELQEIATASSRSVAIIAKEAIYEWLLADKSELPTNNKEKK
jgi:predicted transcriptional regulator